MRNIDENNITDAVVRSFEACDNPRMKEILTSLVTHLHDFVRDVRLTEAEWMEGIDFLTAAGPPCCQPARTPAARRPGEPRAVDIVVTSIDDAPIAGAEVDVWQADEDG